MSTEFTWGKLAYEVIGENNYLYKPAIESLEQSLKILTAEYGRIFESCNGDFGDGDINEAMKKLSYHIVSHEKAIDQLKLK